MPRYWTSRKPWSVVDDRRKELALLLEFANADMGDDENRFLRRSVFERLVNHPAWHPDNRGWKPDRGREGIIDGLQGHLRSRLAKLIEHKNGLVEMPLWQVSGSISFS